ncbi:protein of unknown function [Litoreibacter ascidiaceicola]|uniref:DUF3859 domain-containing protein n=1 Tax=Litoreibacter ascidiaceicola TaxID=1486859 RepID=A0A1M5E3B2_9RHOB|nr:DUF3859 domain-containing protein [Litoreibacter ascidiaceicola]SHF73686.1 protein of unknown function [Litoreibacter ascidiaceicola]
MLATIISGIFPGNGKTPLFLEYGYTADFPQQQHIVSGFDTVDGELIRSRSTEKPLFVNSRKVPATVGVAFGFWVEVPSNVFAKPLRGSVHHPAMGPESRTNQTWPLEKHFFGGRLFVGYRLEDEYELVLGDWTFELWENDLILFEQTLELVDPATLP